MHTFQAAPTDDLQSHNHTPSHWGHSGCLHKFFKYGFNRKHYLKSTFSTTFPEKSAHKSYRQLTAYSVLTVCLSSTIHTLVARVGGHVSEMS